jgi:hypothetical protein
VSAAHVCVVCQQDWGGVRLVKAPNPACPECSAREDTSRQEALPLDGLDAVQLADGGIVVIDADTQWYEELD